MISSVDSILPPPKKRYAAQCTISPTTRHLGGSLEPTVFRATTTVQPSERAPLLLLSDGGRDFYFGGRVGVRSQDDISGRSGARKPQPISNACIRNTTTKLDLLISGLDKAQFHPTLGEVGPVIVTGA